MYMYYCKRIIYCYITVITCYYYYMLNLTEQVHKSIDILQVLKVIIIYCKKK